jgi:hypothetical protein
LDFDPHGQQDISRRQAAERARTLGQVDALQRTAQAGRCAPPPEPNAAARQSALDGGPATADEGDKEVTETERRRLQDLERQVRILLQLELRTQLARRRHRQLTPQAAADNADLIRKLQVELDK